MKYLEDLEFKQISRKKYYSMLILENSLILNDNDLVYNNKVFRTKNNNIENGSVSFDLKDAEIEDTLFFYASIS